nr:MAG TPA: hypothetical protein [Caudoviricetes sp.]
MKEEMAIELPKDAEGRDIPLDIDALYDRNGERLPLFVWVYTPRVNEKWTVQFLFDDSNRTYDPKDYFLIPPDSLKKLLEDLDRAANAKGFGCCAYAGRSERDCSSCIAADDRACTQPIMRDIASRIRKLVGED